MDFCRVINELEQISDIAIRGLALKKIISETQNLLDFSLLYVSIRYIAEDIFFYENQVRVPGICRVANEVISLTETLASRLIESFLRSDILRKIFFLDRKRHDIYMDKKRRKLDANY